MQALCHRGLSSHCYLRHVIDNELSTGHAASALSRQCPMVLKLLGVLKLRLGEQADRQLSLRKCKQRCHKPLTELLG